MSKNDDNGSLFPYVCYGCGEKYQTVAGLRTHYDESNHYQGPHSGGIVAREFLVESEESVNHPAHYGGADNPYEVIKVIEAWHLGFCLGNTIKYIFRSGKKSTADYIEDLKKARWYLDRHIQKLEGVPENANNN